MASFNRATEAEVLEIMYGTAMTEEEIEPYMVTAYHIVEAWFADAEYSETILTQIEIWLSAHLASMADPNIVSEKFGDAAATYVNKFDLGLDHSRYGQQLRLLDYKGILTGLGAEVKVIA